MVHEASATKSHWPDYSKRCEHTCIIHLVPQSTTRATDRSNTLSDCMTSIPMPRNTSLNSVYQSLLGHSHSQFQSQSQPQFTPRRPPSNATLCAPIIPPTHHLYSYKFRPMIPTIPICILFHPSQGTHRTISPLPPAVSYSPPPRHHLDYPPSAS